MEVIEKERQYPPWTNWLGNLQMKLTPIVDYLEYVEI